MTEPINHHFIPRFLQKRWLDQPDDSNGRVYRYTLPHKKVVVKHVSTRASGSEDELYSRRTVKEPKARQAIETDFMSKLDNNAAAALDAIEAKPRQSAFIIVPRSPLPQSHRTAWARFLISMMCRSPYRVRWFVDELHRRWAADRVEAEYERVRSPNDPKEFAEWVNSYEGSVAIDAGAIGVIQMLIDSELIIPHVVGMRWKVISIPNCQPYEFLFSDDAITTSNGMNAPESFMMMPIGAKNLFVAANKEETISAFFAQDLKLLTHAVNDAVVRQAQSTIISRSDGYRDFISERFRPELEGARSTRLTWKAPVVFTSLIVDH